MKRIVLFLVIITFIYSCKNKNQTDKEIISELILKYPELNYTKTSDFNIKRTLKIKNDSISITLYENAEDKFGNKIILLKNFNNDKYAIPLFTNINCKYWSFENEKPTFYDKNFKSLFEKEFINGINKLNLNDNSGTGYVIIYEIINSLLHFQIVTEYDKESSKFSKQILTTWKYQESDQAFEKRIMQNISDLFKGMQKGEFSYEYNAFYDNFEDRIFQIAFPKKWKSKILKLNMKTYRLGQGGGIPFTM